MSAMSWQAIAHVMGERLSYARCDESTHSEADPANCPFCADVAAYQLYAAKVRNVRAREGRTPPSAPSDEARAVPIQDIPFTEYN